MLKHGSAAVYERGDVHLRQNGWKSPVRAVEDSNPELAYLNPEADDNPIIDRMPRRPGREEVRSSYRWLPDAYKVTD